LILGRQSDIAQRGGEPTVHPYYNRLIPKPFKTVMNASLKKFEQEFRVGSRRGWSFLPAFGALLEEWTILTEKAVPCRLL
jgi:hypothetical protein